MSREALRREEAWQTLSGDEVAESTWERGRRRLLKVKPLREGNSFTIQGLREFSDRYPLYELFTDGEGTWWCSCYDHYGGAIRERNVCSHSAACAIFGNLPCQRTRPLRELKKLTPKDLGLPEKFKEWRRGQFEAAKQIAESSKRFFFLQAPTGSGKSLIGATVQRLKRERMLYIVHTKQLEAQIKTDFPYAEVLMGRENYPCLKGEGITALECTKKPERRRCERCSYQSWFCQSAVERGLNCPCVDECLYLLQKKKVLASEFAVLNMALFLTEANLVGEFSGFPFAVLDECDLTESALMSFIELSIPAKIIEKFELKPPRRKTKEEAWLEVIEKQALPRIERRLAELKNAWEPEDVREEEELKRLERRLKFALSEIPKGGWVYIEEGERWSFKPVWISRYAHHYIFRHGQKFLLMSATLINPRQFARDLGIDYQDVEYHELPSLFPKERRPIYFMPCANLTHKTKDEERPKVVEGLDSVLDQHPHEKVLVHTHSYSLAEYVIRSSRHGRRMLNHDGRTRHEVLERFKSSQKPLVLISPSMERGVDLPQDQCRVVIILKVPYLDLGDKQTQTRLYASKDGREWYISQTIRNIVQSAGRAMRSEDDWCKIYILDAQFERLLRESRGIFPKFFLEAIRKGEFSAVVPGRAAGCLPFRPGKKEVEDARS